MKEHMRKYFGHTEESGHAYHESSKISQTNLINSITNITITTIGITKLIQSEYVPFGLFSIISLALGNKNTINMITAIAATIFIQSIFNNLLSNLILSKQNPG